MDRQSIERRDFPIARRGYEIDAVDAHLARIADEYEALARRGRSESPGGLAAAAAEQVRMIVEAAEQSAQDISREAELEARQLRQDAREEAERLRADAGRQAREHVVRAAEVARGLLDRVEGMDRELGSLLEGLRGGSQRLAADLSLLQANVEEIRAAAKAPPSPGEADVTGPADDAGTFAADGGSTSAATGVRAGAGIQDTLLPATTGRRTDTSSAVTELDGGRASDTAGEAEADAAGAAGAEGGNSGAGDVDDTQATDEGGYRPDPSLDAVLDSADTAEAALPAPADLDGASAQDDEGRRLEANGARMVALNMALNGVPREETRGHLEQNFSVDGLDALLDDVYARAGQ
jgi:DivIVA domain-containing protein